MPIDPQIEILLRQLAAEGGPAPESRTVAENRAAGRAFAALAGAAEPVAEVLDTTVPAGDREIPIRIYRPVTEPDAGPLPVTLYFHGGGWVFGDLDTQDHIARTVADRSGTIVVSVDYRLAPEHRFPAATDDAYAALTWVADNAAGFGGDGERIAVFGESAGGNLAATLAQEALRRGGPCITLQVLAYPALDRFDDSPSMYEYTTGPILSRSYLEWFWAVYLGSPDQGGRFAVPCRRDQGDHLRLSSAHRGRYSSTGRRVAWPREAAARARTARLPASSISRLVKPVIELCEHDDIVPWHLTPAAGDRCFAGRGKRARTTVRAKN
ncbi:alpha/beta hydrolase [Streptomyces sp. NPDC093093]|uniref:alpha/beta hydrolase n=1 Tax=Streptomyces sp. NPDC093093 TaxID=3366025 RepID=UPI0037FBA10E